MSDIFKSALDYFSSSFSAENNDYVGSNVELGNVKLKIKRLIAEGENQNCLTVGSGRLLIFFNILQYCSGGSGMVFVAQAQDTGKEYALKVRSCFTFLFYV